MAMGSVGRKAHGRRRAPMAEINVTPLVDVMLVLLIIFMVTAPLLVAGVPVNLPQSRAGALDQDKQPIQISLDGEGRVFLDDEQVSMAALPTRLAARKAPAGQDQPQVFLRADRQLDYGKVMAVMGELSHTGLTKVALVSEGAERGQGGEK